MKTWRRRHANREAKTWRHGKTWRNGDMDINIDRETRRHQIKN
jgi:hypothetical protein